MPDNTRRGFLQKMAAMIVGAPVAKFVAPEVLSLPNVPLRSISAVSEYPLPVFDETAINVPVLDGELESYIVGTNVRRFREYVELRTDDNGFLT